MREELEQTLGQAMGSFSAADRLQFTQTGLLQIYGNPALKGLICVFDTFSGFLNNYHRIPLLCQNWCY